MLIVEKGVNKGCCCCCCCYFYHNKMRFLNTVRQFVYVIGLHAVQFGNNWMKNSEDSQNWTRPQAESNLAVRGILGIQIFPNWTSMHAVLLLINYIASQFLALLSHRGYYTVARRYEFYVRVARTTDIVLATRT